MPDPDVYEPEQAVDPTGQAAGMNRLREYLLDRIAELDLTQAEVSRRSGLSRQHVADILYRDRPRIPDADLLDRLAVALEVPRRVLRQIAAEAYGYVISSPDDDTSLILASLEELPEGRRRDVAKLIDLYRKEASEQEERRKKPGGDGR